MRAAQIWPAALLALTIAGPAGAQAGDTAAPEKKITLNLRDVPLRSAVETLFAGSGLQYTIDPTVPNVPITLALRDVTVPSALRVVVRQGAALVPGLTITRDGEVYTVRIRPPAPAPVPSISRAPEAAPERSEVVIEKIPLQYIDVRTLVAAFGGAMLPSELDVLMRGSGYGGGFGGNGGGYGGYGGGYGGGLMGGYGSDGYLNVNPGYSGGNGFGGNGFGYGGGYGQGLGSQGYRGGFRRGRGGSGRF